jgi:type IV pilus assembly protein PilC
MKFLYTAKTQKGEVQTGLIETGSREGALSTLQGFGLVVLQVREEKEQPLLEKLLASFRMASTRDLSIFTRQLATLLSAQIPLIDALRTMFQQTQNPYLKEAIFDAISDIESGASLSQAFSRHEAVFSPFFVQMVRSAEITGRLQEVFEYLADYLEMQFNLNSKIRGALIYPAFVLVMFAVVIAVMVTMVVPQLKQVFIDAGMDLAGLPFVTQVLFGTGDFVGNYGAALFVAFVAMAFALRAYFKSAEGKLLLDMAVLRIPYFSDIARKVYLARFSETTSVMIKGDIPIAQALEVAGDVVANAQYRYLIFEAAEAVRRGESISEALARSEKEFPALITQMITMGEKTGRLDEMMHRISQFYAKEVERLLANISELIQPILIIVLGILVGLLIGAIILPIFQLAATV